MLQINNTFSVPFKFQLALGLFVCVFFIVVGLETLPVTKILVL